MTNRNYATPLTHSEKRSKKLARKSIKMPALAALVPALQQATSRKQNHQTIKVQNNNCAQRVRSLIRTGYHHRRVWAFDAFCTARYPRSSLVGNNRATCRVCPVGIYARTNGIIRQTSLALLHWAVIRSRCISGIIRCPRMALVYCCNCHYITCWGLFPVARSDRKNIAATSASTSHHSTNIASILYRGRARDSDSLLCVPPVRP